MPQAALTALPASNLFSPPVLPSNCCQKFRDTERDHVTPISHPGWTSHRDCPPPSHVISPPTLGNTFNMLHPFLGASPTPLPQPYSGLLGPVLELLLHDIRLSQAKSVPPHRAQALTAPLSSRFTAPPGYTFLKHEPGSPGLTKLFSVSPVSLKDTITH